MSAPEPQRDLVVLVADKNTKSAIGALLRNPKRLRIRDITSEVFVHPGHDPGCREKCHDFLRAQTSRFRHALVIFDRHGCGRDAPAEAIESDSEQRLAASGWEDRARAVVIDPELEVWVWSDSPHVEDVLGWQGRSPALRDWLVSEGRAASVSAKPRDPKAAIEDALRIANVPRSSAVYASLASRVSFNRCKDRAFLKFCNTVRAWFPAR